MALKGLFLCSLIILTARFAHPLPQGLNNFGWSAIQRIQPTNFVFNEPVVKSVPVMAGVTPFSSVAPTKKSGLSATGQQKPAIKDLVPESRQMIDKIASSTIQSQNNLDDVTTPTPVAENTTSSSTVQVPLKNMSVKTTQAPSSGSTSLLGSETTQLFSAGVAVLGGVLGREGCYLKAACLAGTLVPSSSLQGRDMMVTFAETLVPTQWKEIIQAAKSSMLQGHDCSRFNCF